MNFADSTKLQLVMTRAWDFSKLSQWMSENKTSLTMLGQDLSKESLNNSTNINNMSNYLSSQIIEQWEKQDMCLLK